MQPRYDAYLVRKFPNLFASRFADKRTTATCWGFECGDGWYRIVKEAAEKLEPLIVAEKEKHPGAWEQGYYRATQVKEKFGTLRIYLSSETEEMSRIVDEAERKSAKTCEKCGKPGKLRGRGWVYTACRRHTRDE